MLKKKCIYIGRRVSFSFLMVCLDYDNIRLNFFPSNMVENVSLNKFYSFMNSKKRDIISLAKYLYFVFEKCKFILGD